MYKRRRILLFMLLFFSIVAMLLLIPGSRELILPQVPTPVSVEESVCISHTIGATSRGIANRLAQEVGVGKQGGNWVWAWVSINGEARLVVGDADGLGSLTNMFSATVCITSEVIIIRDIQSMDNIPSQVPDSQIIIEA